MYYLTPRKGLLIVRCFGNLIRTNINTVSATIVFTTRLFCLWSGTYLHLQHYLVRWNPPVLYTFMNKIILFNLARYCHQHYLLRFHRIRIHANIHFCISVRHYKVCYPTIRRPRNCNHLYLMIMRLIRQQGIILAII